MIKNFAVRNFRSLRSIFVELAPLTVLVGRAGSGKSNFVKAIRFVRDALITPGQPGAALRGLGWSEIYSATAPRVAANQPYHGQALPEQSLSFSIVFEIPGLAGEFDYAFTMRSTNALQSFDLFSEHLIYGKKPLFSHENGKWLVEPNTVTKPDPHGLVLGTLNGVPESSLAHTYLTTAIGCYDFQGDVLQKRHHGGQAAEGFDDDASNYITAFDSISKNLRNLGPRREIVAATKLLNSSVSDISLTVPQKNMRLFRF